MDTPSRFGSHASMHVDPILEDTLLTPEQVASGLVVCRDAHGYYVTYAKRLDTGLADPCRYGESFRLQ